MSNFSLAFTIQLAKNSPGDSPRDQTVLVKAESPTSPTTPLHVKVTANGLLQLSYWAAGEDGRNTTERNFASPSDKPFLAGEAYRVFISRELVYVKGTDDPAPRPFQMVTMRAWSPDGSLYMQLPPSPEQRIHGPVQGNEAPLCFFGGAQWSEGRGLRGIVGCIKLYSSAIPPPASVLDLYAASGGTMIGSWSCRDAGSFSLIDDLGRNHGKLKGNLRWVLSPYKSDHQLSVFVNATRVKA